MKQSTITIESKGVDIRALAGSLYQTTNIKSTKSAVNSNLNGGVLKAGLAIKKDGTVSTDGANAYGILFADVDFNNSTGTEILPVCIFGFLSKAKIQANTGAEVHATTITNLPLIKFMD